jgi:phage major head subunit gpT-like protein
MKNSIKLTEISIDQAINHSRNEYNPYEWKKQINQLTNWFSNVKFYEFNNEVYSIYNSNGIASIKRMEYMNCIDNGGLKSYILKNDELIEYPIRISKSKNDLELATFLSTQGLVFASVYFNI